MARYILNPSSKVYHDSTRLTEPCNTDDIERRAEADIVPRGYSACRHCNDVAPEPAPAEGNRAMTWKLTDKAEGQEPFPGIAWRDYSEEEFRELARDFAERNNFPRMSLHSTGFWEHIEEKPAEKGKED